MKHSPGTVHVPPSAVAVWTEGHSLVIRFEDSHSVRVPLNKWTDDGHNVGYEIFKRILAERETACGPIASKSRPVQHDVEKMVKEYGKPITKPKAKIGTEDQQLAATAVLRRLGMI